MIHHCKRHDVKFDGDTIDGCWVCESAARAEIETTVHVDCYADGALVMTREDLDVLLMIDESGRLESVWLKPGQDGREVGIHIDGTCLSSPKPDIWRSCREWCAQHQDDVADAVLTTFGIRLVDDPYEHPDPTRGIARSRFYRPRAV